MQKEIPKSVYISGLGAVSAIGNNVKECYTALSECRHGIGKVTLFNTLHNSPVGEVKLHTAPDGISRTSFLGLEAARQALEDSGISNEELLSGKIRIGIVSSTTVGGMDISEKIYPSLFGEKGENSDNKEYSDRELFKSFRQHPSDESTNYIADTLNIKNYRATLSTACSSAANAIIVGERLIRHNILDCVIVGGCDSLSKFTYNGFNSLKILSENLCRPFDDNRDGLNLGEGAGYIVLQNEKTLKRRPYCIVSGCANANDAYHQTASSENGEGDYLAMKQAIEMAGLQPEDIHYINAHGTGTPNNDSSEFAAMRRIWGDKMPPFSSTKCYTGHTLAAAGGIEAVFSVLAICHGAIYANINCSSTENLNREPDGKQFAPAKNFSQGGKIKNVLSNSFGFGGNASTVVFSAIDDNWSVPAVETDNDAENGTNGTNSCLQLPNFGLKISNIVSFSNELDVKALIPDSNMRRRMSSIIKMGVAAAMKSLQELPETKPDAIITTTWLGCLTDSEKFLKNITENGENLLNPTPFIQSTFNAVGGQIALLTKNHSYNNTYTDRKDGLTNAMLDAYMLIKEGKARSVLVGIMNETTPTLELIIENINKGEATAAAKCTLPEHGATFFIVSA